MKALCLKDYGTDQTNYATLVENGIKTLETRTWATQYRGDLLITCSASSKTENAGKAVCVVTLSGCEEMKQEHEEKACIKTYPKAKVWHLENLRFLSEKFSVKSRLSLFEVEIPREVAMVSANQNSDFTLTAFQAKGFAERGFKIQHCLFYDNKFLFLDGGIWYWEDGFAAWIEFNPINEFEKAWRTLGKITQKEINQIILK